MASQLYGPIYKGVFSDISPLLSTPDFLVTIAPAQIAWALQSITYSLPSPFSRVFEERAYASYPEAFLPCCCIVVVTVQTTQKIPFF
jgi:hypothetical protein